MESDDELKTLLLECFWVRRPELQPGVEYTAKQIFKPIWGEFDNGEKRQAGVIFNKLVLAEDIPMECLGESRRTGHSLIYRLR